MFYLFTFVYGMSAPFRTLAFRTRQNRYVQFFEELQMNASFTDLCSEIATASSEYIKPLSFHLKCLQFSVICCEIVTSIERHEWTSIGIAHKRVYQIFDARYTFQSACCCSIFVLAETSFD